MEQNFLILAFIATSIYFMKLAMVFIGADDEFLELEHPGHRDDGFKIFTIQSLIAFLIGAGWAGWGFLYNGIQGIGMLLGASVAGVLAVASSLALIHWAKVRYKARLAREQQAEGDQGERIRNNE